MMAARTSLVAMGVMKVVRVWLLVELGSGRMSGWLVCGR